jgi:FMN phosphatase YigB (HAD superfamily)
MQRKQRRIAFDLDETLGTPAIAENTIVGFNIRQGCEELLEELSQDNELVVWTVSRRSYVQKVLEYGLRQYFSTIYSWDEVSLEWKDIRQLHIDYLIDDSAYHRDEAQKHGMASQYIIVPAYGSPEDNANPLAWVAMVRAALE